MSDRCLNKVIVYFAVLIFGALLSSSAYAATLQVCSVGCDSTTIQGAIDLATAGDTINVSASSYSETLTINKGVAIVSSGSSADTSIQANAGGVFINVQGTASNFNLSGFNLIPHSATTFVIQLANAPSNVMIEDNIINTTGGASQGISIGNSGATGLVIRNNHFFAETNNGGSSDGSIWGPLLVDATVSGNTFSGSSSGVNGGYAIQFSGVTGTSIISDNVIDNYGQGISIFHGEGVSGLTISGNNISGTNNGLRFGQYKATGGADGDMDNVTIINNKLASNNIAIRFHPDGANVLASNFTVKYNDIIGSITYGVDNSLTSGEVVNATYNYWGSVSPNFTAIISGVVDYTPWMNSPFDVTPSAPTVLIIKNGDGYTNNAIDNVTLIAGTYTPDLMAFSLDNSTWTGWAVWNKSYLLNLTDTTIGGSSSDGNKTVYVKVKDYAGNEQLVHNRDSVLLDRVAPYVSSVSLAGHNSYYISPNGDLNYDNVSVDLEYSESSSYSIYITNATTLIKTLGTGTAQNPVAKIWNGKDESGVIQPDGIYYIKTNLSDAAENTNNSIIVSTITIDNTAPTISQVFPLTFDEDTATTLYATYSDSGSGINSCKLYVNGVLNGSMAIVNSTYVNGTITLPQPGTYSVYANCSDNVLNYNNNPTTLTVKDITSPTYTINAAPTNGTTGESVVVNVTSADNVAVSSANITINGIAYSMTKSGDVFNYTISIPSGSLSSIYYNVTVYDSSLNSNTTVTYTITVTDNDVPIYTVNAASTNGTTGENVVVNVTGADNIAISSANITVDGVAYAMNKVGNVFDSTILIPSGSLSSISYNVTVYDSSLNSNTTATYTITVTDNDAPVVVINSPVSANYKSDFIVNLTVSDNIMLKNVSYRLETSTNQSQWILAELAGNYWLSSFSISSVPDANYSIRINATDTSGNSNSVNVVQNIVIDRAAPAVVGELPLNASFTNNPMPVIRANVTDVTSGVNLSSIELRVKNVKVSPTIILVNNIATLSFQVGPYDDSDIVTAKVSASDNTGNAMADYTWAFKVDIVNPGISGAAVDDADRKVRSTDTINLSIIATDDLAGISSVLAGPNSVSMLKAANDTYFVLSNATALGLTAGNNTLLFTVTDSAGNTNSVSLDVIVDDTAPAVSNAVVNNSLVRSIDYIQINVTVDDINLATGKVNVSNNSSVAMQKVGASNIWSTVTTPSLLGCSISDGNCPLIISAEDDVGNKNSTQVTITIDDASPFISWLAVNRTILKSTEKFKVNASVNDSHTIASVKLNNFNMNNIGNEYYLVNTSSELGCSGSSCNLTIVAADIFSNIRTQTIAIIVDDTNPSVTDFASDDTIVKSTQQLNLTAVVSDANNLSSVSVNNTPLEKIGSANIWYLSTNASHFGCAQGTCTLLLTAKDNADNLNNTATLSLTVDDTAPSYLTISQAPATVYNNDTVKLNITWNDANGVSVVYIEHNASGNWTNGTVLNNGAVYYTTITSPLLDNRETISWRSYAVDNAGNINVSMPLQAFTVQNRVPVKSTIPTIAWNEDTTATINLSQYFVDPDGDDLDYAAVNVNNITIAINNVTNIATLTPGANFYGTRYVTFISNDGISTTDSNNVTLTVNPLNDEAPVVSAFPTIVFNEDSFNDTISLDDYVTDTDTNDSHISWTKISGSENILFSVTSDRKANFTAVKDFNGAASMVLQASDGSNNDFGGVNIQVVAQNDVPTTPALSLPLNNSMQDYTSVLLKWNASAQPSDETETVYYYVYNGENKSDLTLQAKTSSTQYNVTGLTDAHTYYWKVVATDGTSNSSASETRQYTIILNYAPSITSYYPLANPAMSEAGSQLFNITKTDPDTEDALTVSWYVDNVLNVSGTDSFTFATGYDDAGIHNVTVVVSDPSGASVSRKWTVSVSSINRAPVYNGTMTELVWNEDTNYSLNLRTMFYDPDSDSLTFGSTVANNITIQNNNGLVTLAPGKDFNGVRYVNFTASDNTYTASSGSIKLNITPVSDAPIITTYTPLFNDPKLPLNSLQQFTAAATDIDGITPTLTWHVDSVQSGTGNSFNYTTSAAGTFNITVIASDGELTSAQQWILTVSQVPIAEDYKGETTNFSAISNLSAATNVKVENTSAGKIDFGPEIMDLTQSIDIDNRLVITKNLVAVDTIALAGLLNQNATITLKGLAYDRTPVIYYNSGFTTDPSLITTPCPSTICYNVNYDVVTGTLTFDVAHLSSYAPGSNTTNTNPRITSTPVQTATENIQYSYDVEAVDEDSDAYTFSLLTSPAGMTINNNSGLIRWTPAHNQLGNNTVIVQVSDNRLGTGTQTFAINVAAGPRLLISDLDIEVDGDSDNNLNDRSIISKEAKPGSKVDVKIKVKNQYSEEEELEINDILITAVLKDIDDGDDLEEESEEFDLEPEDSDRETLTFNIPTEVDESTYDLEITVEGEDENNTFHQLEWVVYLDVEKERHDIQITKTELSESIIELPDTEAMLTINLVNYGRDDEEEVAFEVVNTELGINIRQDSIELTSDLFEADSKYSRTLILNVSDKAKPGVYPITVRVYHDNELDDEKTVTLTLEQAVVTKQEERKEVVKETKQAETKPAVSEKKAAQEPVKKTTEIRFIDRPEYLLLLAVAFIMMLCLVIFALGILVFMSRKR